MYTLYINKKDRVLTLKKAAKHFHNLDFTEQPRVLNENYRYCARRKPLREEAEHILANWKAELEADLAKVRNLKI